MSWRGLPVFGIFLFVLAGLVLAPTFLALSQGLWVEAKAFGFAFVLIGVAALLLTLAYYGRVSPAEARGEFITLGAVLVVGALVRWLYYRLRVGLSNRAGRLLVEEEARAASEAAAAAAASKREKATPTYGADTPGG